MEQLATLAVESIAFDVFQDPIFGHKSNSTGIHFLGIQFWARLEILENHFVLYLLFVLLFYVFII